MHKSCPVKVKAAGAPDGLEEGQFEAIVSVFGNKDSYGDIVVPGAFTDTLAEWAAKGDPIPVYWSHRMDDPDYNIGWVLDAKETSEGLYVKAQLDLESTKAAQVYRLLKGRRVTQFSFAYDIDEAAWVEKDGESWYELRKLGLHEVGPTPIGANQETELLAVKAAAHHAETYVAAVKAGRVISAKNETTLREAQASLEDAAAQIKSVLQAIEPAGGNDGKAKADEPAKDEEPAVETPEAKSEEPMRPILADLSALQSIELAAIGE
jgi:HK97 family phage prohead protease